MSNSADFPSNYANSMIQQSNQDIAARGLNTTPQSLYSQLSDGFKQNMESQANQRANQQLDIAQADLGLRSDALNFNQSQQLKQMDLQTQKFDLYKRLQDTLYPTQQKQAQVQYDLMDHQANSQAATMDAVADSQKKKISSNSLLSQFGHQLGSLSDDDVASGKAEGLLGQYGSDMTASDLTQAQNAVSNMKHQRTVNNLMQQHQSQDAQDMQLQLEKRTWMNNNGFTAQDYQTDPNIKQSVDSGFSQYKQTLAKATTPQQGATIAYNPNGTIKSVRQPETYPAFNQRNGVPLTEKDRVHYVNSRTDRIQSTEGLGSDEAFGKATKEFEKLKSSQTPVNLKAVDQGGSQAAPSAPADQPNSVLNNLQ